MRAPHRPGSVNWRRIFLPLTASVALSLAAAIATSSASAVTSTAFTRIASSHHAVPVCEQHRPGYASCLALRLISNNVSAAQLQSRRQHNDSLLSRKHKLTLSEVARPEPVAGAYGPQELHEAYELPKETEAAGTQTIAIVDAFDDPNIEGDLAVYSTKYDLPECTSTNGCFKKVNEEGNASPLPAANGGWATEESLDVEMAHAICPECHIVLVEAKSETITKLAAAENEAVTLGATEISNSYGEEEGSGNLVVNADYNHPGIVITAASGDDGYENWDGSAAGIKTETPDFPASSENVVAVGGTTLTKNGAKWESTVWEKTGGGCETAFTAQPWQQEVLHWSETECGTHRLDSDISVVGDPATGVSVYDSYPGGEGETGWEIIGGTSVASPIMAAEFALAGGSGGVEYPSQTLYENAKVNPADVYDVTKGGNDMVLKPWEEEAEFREELIKEYQEDPEIDEEEARQIVEAEYGPQQPEPDQKCFNLACNAAPGYDGPSGLGSPLGLAVFKPNLTEEEPSVLSNPVVSDESGSEYFTGDKLVTTNGVWKGTPVLHYTYQWQRCNSSGGECANISGANSVHYEPVGEDANHTIRSVVTATNTLGHNSGTSAATKLVSLRPPLPGSLSSPTVTDRSGIGYYIGDTLVATQGTWSNSPTQYFYQWELCNASGAECGTIGGATESEYTVISADLSHTLRIDVTARNAGGNTEAKSAHTPTITNKPFAPIDNAPPTVTSTNGYQAGDTINTTSGEWLGSPTSYTYQWQLCNVSGAECGAINGATNSSYTLVSADVGKTLEAIVTATNGGGHASAASAATPVITAASAAPVDTQPPTISALSGYEADDVFEANNGSWEGNPSGYSYQWELCGVSGSGCEAISNATGDVYTSIPADVGKTLRVTVTATNSFGNASAASAATPVITNPVVNGNGSMPVPVVAPTISGSPTIGAVLTVNDGIWSGTSPITYSYEWVDCFPGTAPSLSTCKLAANGSGATYTVTTNDVGYSLAVIVTASNSLGAKSEYSKITTAVTAPPKEGTAELTSHSFKVSTSGHHDYITVAINCKNAACHGILSLSYRSGKRTLVGATTHYSAKSGATDKIKITLNSSIAKILRSHRNLAATLGVRPGTGALHNYAVTLHRKK